MDVRASHFSGHQRDKSLHSPRPVYKGTSTVSEQVGWRMRGIVECPGVSGIWLAFQFMLVASLMSILLPVFVEPFFLWKISVNQEPNIKLMRSQSYGNIPLISSKHPVEGKVTLGYAEKIASLVPA